MIPDEFAEKVRTSRAAWDRLVAGISPANMETPGVEPGWSLKDIIAHITWFEREMVGVLRGRALVGSDLWNLPRDERNAAIYEVNRGRPLVEVQAEARQVYAELFSLVKGLTAEELNESARFKDMPPDWVPWEVLAGNTYEHYDDHARDVRAWLQKEE